MQFEYSLVLAVGALACVGLVWAFVRSQKTQRLRLKQFAAPHLVEALTASVSIERRKLKLSLLVLATACAFLALARPQAGFRWEETHRKGIDILLAVDCSKSMLADDVQPNRLERARLGILDFVAELDGDRVGLLPFSGTAFLMCPLTLDYDAFRQSLNALDATLMPRGGTDIARAIREAEVAFEKDANHRILVLVTDGEDLEGEALSAAKAAAERGITIHTVGVGTPAGELIPSGTGFVKDESGQVVTSRLDEDMLGQIAEATGGAYAPFGRQAEGLDTIYQEKLSLVPEEEFAQRMRKVPLERFEWPLLLALIFLSLEYVLSDRKKTRERRGAAWLGTLRRRMPRRGAATAGLVGGLILAGLIGRVQASPQAGEKAYQAGDFPEAAAQYMEAQAKDPGDARLTYNAGAAAYKSGAYAEAAAAFNALAGDEDLSMQEQAYYNLGNTLYREGQQTEAENPQRTIQQWQQALKAYEGTLALNAEDVDAQFNHELVKRRLEALQKEQEQQQEENPESENPERQQDSESQEDSEKQQQEEEEPGEPGEGQGDQPEPAENGNEQEESAGEGLDEDGSSGQPEQAPGQPEPSQAGQDTPEGMGERRQPGEMTPEEAEDLLDSLKGDDGDTPFVPAAQGGAGGRDEDDRRDW